MKTQARFALALPLVLSLVALSLVACGEDDAPAANPATAGAGGSAAGTGGSDSAGSGGSSTDNGGAAGTSAAGAGGSGTAGSAGKPANTCGSSADQVLNPIDSVATGAVAVLEEKTGYKIIYVDASAGGSMAQDKNPRVYVDLAACTAIAVSDEGAKTSSDWDLAIKRPILFTNSGDGGPGEGGLVFLEGKNIEDVTAADATDKTFAAESFFDADCEPKLDQTNALATSFDGWYEYDGATSTLTPTVGTYLLKGGKGAVFKVQILSYYSTASGEIGTAGGRYKLAVGPL